MKRLLYGLVALGLLVGGAGQAKGQPSYVYTTLDVPGSNSSEALGLNNLGQIVGSYGDLPRDIHGFLWNGSSFTTIDVPAHDLTWANGINDGGQIVVRAFFGPDRFDAFLLRNGSYTPIGLGTDPNATGINTLGQIVGSYYVFGGAAAPRRGFLLSGDSYTVIDIPNSLNSTTAQGINDKGQIVGGVGFFGDLLDNGRIRFLTVPGSLDTQANGINNVGQIVGEYEDGTGMHGFLLADGSYSSIDFPGSTGTLVSGINDAGEIVGYYLDRMGNQHGFLATPVPEPSALLPVAIGTLGVIGWVWWRRMETKAV